LSRTSVKHIPTLGEEYILNMFQKRVLWRILWPDRKRVLENSRSVTMRNFIICTRHPALLGQSYQGQCYERGILLTPKIWKAYKTFNRKPLQERNDFEGIYVSMDGAWITCEGVDWICLVKDGIGDCLLWTQ
jgi:hypothetical protein